MDKLLAKEKLTQLIDGGKTQTAQEIVTFLEGCVPQKDFAEIQTFSEKRTEIYLKEMAEKERQHERMWQDARCLVNEAVFSWDEMMEILEDAGGVIVFNAKKETTLFSRYDRYGHLISTIGRDYYAPLQTVKDEVLLPYKDKDYQINTFYGSWNDLQAANYLTERKEQKQMPND